MLFTQTFATFIGAHRDWHLPGAPFLLSALLARRLARGRLRVMATQACRARRRDPSTADL